MEFDVFIPVRFGSRRLPGKPLIDIQGKPLIQYVYESARSSSASGITVTTDDDRIADTVRGFGGEVIQTSPQHASGTDRIAEAVDVLGLSDERIIVNVQGDEPQMPGALINQVASALLDQPEAVMSTACYPITDRKEHNNPNVVKVVADSQGWALYFSRAPIPWYRDIDGIHAHRHIGIYGYRVGLLRRFTRWETSELEKAERLEQLRVLYHGGRILVCPAAAAPGIGIDTQEDLEKFAQSLSSD